MKRIPTTISALLIAFVPMQAQAYIGPGMGLGLAVTVLGLFVVFVLLLVGLIWLPIRRFLRQGKQKQQTNTIKHESDVKFEREH